MAISALHLRRPRQTEIGTVRSFALERFAEASPANGRFRRLWLTQSIERRPLIQNNPHRIILITTQESTCHNTPALHLEIQRKSHIMI